MANHLLPIEQSTVLNIFRFFLRIKKKSRHNLLLNPVASSSIFLNPITKSCEICKEVRNIYVVPGGISLKF